MSSEQEVKYRAEKSDEMQFVNPERGRANGMKQLLEEKSYPPGLGDTRRDIEMDSQER